MNLRTHGAWMHYTYRVWMSLQGIPEFKENNKKGWESQQASLGNLSDILLFSWGKSKSASQQTANQLRMWVTRRIHHSSNLSPSPLISQSENQCFNFLSALGMLLCVSHHSHIAASFKKESASSTPPLDFFFLASPSYMCRCSFNGKESLSATLL